MLFTADWLSLFMCRRAQREASGATQPSCFYHSEVGSKSVWAWVTVGSHGPVLHYEKHIINICPGT